MTDNARVAAVFTQLADLLEVQGANPFRVRAYRNAARTVEGLGKELRALLDEGYDLTKLAGIGRDLAEKIEEILATGTSEALEELHQEVPASLEQLLAIPNLGPKRVKQLFHELNIADLDGLKTAAEQGRLREIKGLGAKTEQAVLQAIAAEQTRERRFLLSDAEPLAEAVRDHLLEAKGVREVVVAGSYRRGRDTVGDLDILVTAARDNDVMQRFVAFAEVSEVRSRGDTRSTVILNNGLQVDLRLVPRTALGAALHYFTGSKAHNIQVRRLGQKRGLKINEYGVFRGDQRIAGRTEASVFKAVGLPEIAPELREDRGEIDAARARRTPGLIEVGDLRGDLHMHTLASDGRASIEDMAKAARQRGLRYIAITDHSRSARIANGLDKKRLRKQLEEIDRLNQRLKGITLLKGCEVDILADGKLDFPDSVLKELDVVIGAVHQRHGLDPTRQTERILRAMDNRYFGILAHPSGRLLLEREPMEVDMARIVRHAAQRGCFLELDSQPKRLDLNDTYCAMAREEGVLVSIDSDAHASDQLDFVRFGIRQARRGWLEKANVLNTRPLKALQSLLNKARA